MERRDLSGSYQKPLQLRTKIVYVYTHNRYIFFAKRRPDRLSAESDVIMQILCQGGETDLYLAVPCQK